MRNQRAQSFKPLTISAEKLPASMARQETQTSYAAERARLLFGCYRTGDANDPETYVAAITAVLARYPEEIITRVTHPVTGLPHAKSWLPTVKEVTDACMEAHELTLESVAREKRIADQIAARNETERERPTLDHLKEKYGKNWGIGEEPGTKVEPEPAPTKDQLRHHYQHFNLSFKPKNHAELEEHIERGFSPSTV